MDAGEAGLPVGPTPPEREEDEEEEEELEHPELAAAETSTGQTQAARTRMRRPGTGFPGPARRPAGGRGGEPARGTQQQQHEPAGRERGAGA